jgi:hypothetical protein
VQQGGAEKGEIAGLIVTARAQLYVLEQAIERSDAELVDDFTRRLAQTAQALRVATLLEFPIRFAAAEYAGARECCMHVPT